MNQLQVFNHLSFGELPAIYVDEKPYFGAKSAAIALGYSNTSDAITRHTKKDGVVFHEVIDSLGRKQNAKFISEGNLYRLITNSKLPNAEQFESWIFDEVLPSIRKEGGYIATSSDDDEMTIMAKAMMIADKTIQRQKRENIALHQKIEADAPYTKFGKVVAITDGAVNIGTFVKMIYEKHGVNIGRNKLIAWLRDNGYLIKKLGAERNLPKQRYIEQGWFRVRPAVVARTDGDMQTGTTLITGKGQIALTDILIKEFARKAN